MSQDLSSQDIKTARLEVEVRNLAQKHEHLEGVNREEHANLFKEVKCLAKNIARIEGLHKVMITLLLMLLALAAKQVFM